MGPPPPLPGGGVGEGYNFLSNLVQFPIHCILLYFVLYSAVFSKISEIRCILPYFESVEFGQICPSVFCPYS